SRATIKPKAVSSSLPSGKRAKKSTSADYEKEIRLIRQENAELVAMGDMTQEEAQEAEELLGSKEQPAKKKKLGSSAQLFSDVASHFGELKAFEQKRMEAAEKRQRERDERAAEKDSFIRESEEKKIAIANAMVEVLSGLLKKKEKKQGRKRK
ncbi:Uncharacterized protein APZ42_021269, partial [Daphnia magna]